MRLYSTEAGIGREDQPGILSLLALEFEDIGELLRNADLSAARDAEVVSRRPVGELTVLAPVRRPSQIIIAGLNYPSHAEEAREMMASMGREHAELPTEPSFQLLPAASVTDPETEILLPVEAAEQVDYEGEVTIVVARQAHHVDVDQAWDYIAGLTIANDVSARDIQFRALTGDTTVTVADAKSFDTFKPLGPCLATIDDFARPIDLRLQTRVNGELRQDDRTGTVLFDFAHLLAHISAHQPLEPGDLILTGTPAGAAAFAGGYLSDGDVVEIEVEGIGVLRNRVAK